MPRARFKVVTAMNIQVVVFWIVTPFTDVAGHWHFR